MMKGEKVHEILCANIGMGRKKHVKQNNFYHFLLKVYHSVFYMYILNTDGAIEHLIFISFPINLIVLFYELSLRKQSIIIIF